MKKLTLLTILLGLTACNNNKTNYHFRYEGKDALIPCNDSKYMNLMCEKDGITLANGIWANKIAENEIVYNFYSQGILAVSDSYIEKSDVRSITTTLNGTYVYCKDNKVCNIACKNPEPKKYDINITGAELAKVLKETNGKFNCSNMKKK